MKSFYFRLCAIISFLTISTICQAQHNYNFTAASGDYNPISGGTDVDEIEFDDRLSSEIPIGFGFNYFGEDYTTIKASANGYLTFDISKAFDYSSNVLPTSNNLKSIAPLWDDLSGSPGGIPPSARYITTGSEGNRVFTFEWNRWRWNRNSSQAISFQVKLYETTNVIEFIYQQEGSPLDDPSASIGIIGNNRQQFYALTDATATSKLYPIPGVIGLKPATGQRYLFTPATLAPVSPSIQASNISGTLNVRSTILSWEKGDGDYRVVFMKKKTSVVEDLTLIDGNFYSPRPVYGHGEFKQGWYCVYNGDGSTVTVTGLEPGETYHIKTFEYNGLGGNQRFLGSSATNNPVDHTTLLTKPGSPISQIEVLRVTGTEVTLDVEEGDGIRRAVFLKAGTSGTAPVVDNTSYGANYVFGQGSQVGSSGWYCVNNGQLISPFIVTGLSEDTDYVLHVVDYNGPLGSERYNISSGEGNPALFTTIRELPSIQYNFEALSGTFTELSNSTSISSFGGDDVIGDDVPIGFMFRFNGYQFSTIYPSSNGLISFSPYIRGNSHISNNLAGAVFRPLIAPLWDDLQGGEGSYATTGTAPNRVFTIQYLNWRWNYQSNPNVISFQVKLYETSNRIEFLYKEGTAPLNGSRSASIGLAFQNSRAGNYLSLSDSGPTPTVSSTVESTGINSRPVTGQIYRFTPEKLDQTLTFDPITDKTVGDEFDLAATVTSGLSVVYTSSNPDVATVSGNTITIVGVGSVTITARQPGNDLYNQAPEVSHNFVVSKGSQSINFSLPSAIGYSPSGLQLNATATSGLTVTYESSNSAVATISGSVLTTVAPGTVDIIARQQGNSNYHPAADVTRTLIINKADQTIDFSLPSPIAYSTSGVQLNATTSSGLPVTYESLNSAVATISGSVLTIIVPGTVDIVAKQQGNGNYNPAANVTQTVTINKADQTITFAPLEMKFTGDAPFDLDGASSSGLPVSFASDNADVAVVSGNTVTIIGHGTTNITASQDGNQYYNSTSVTNPLVVKSTQSITVGNISDKMIGDVFTVDAVTTSGLPVILNKNTGNPTIVISGSEITIVDGAGPVSLLITQEGNEYYTAANPVQATFCVNPAKPEVELSLADPENPVLQVVNATAGDIQWFKDGAPISGATSVALNPVEAGSYSVSLTIEGCSSELSEGVSLIITGVETFDHGVKIFPNPVMDELVIDVGSLNEYATEVSITDVTGKRMGTASGYGVIRLNTSSYKPGNYILKISNGLRSISKQIIKK